MLQVREASTGSEKINCLVTLEGQGGRAKRMIDMQGFEEHFADSGVPVTALTPPERDTYQTGQNFNNLSFRSRPIPPILFFPVVRHIQRMFARSTR